MPVTALRPLPGLLLLEPFDMADLIDLAAEKERRLVALKERRPEPQLWCCDCGCVTFYHWSSGAVQCADCKIVQNGHCVPTLPAG